MLTDANSQDLDRTADLSTEPPDDLKAVTLPEGNSSSTAEEARGSSQTTLGLISIVAGILGWWASLRLFLDYTASLKDSALVPSCDLSATVSCAQNYGSSYGSIFGFSNTVIGLALFVVPVVLGVLLLAKVSLPRWIHIGYSIGLLAGVVLISYLQYASFSELKTLCVYCLLIWTVTIVLFWAALRSSLLTALLPATSASSSVDSMEAASASANRVPTNSSSPGLLKRVASLIVENWWLLALAHLVAVLAWGELSISAGSELIAVLSG